VESSEDLKVLEGRETTLVNDERNHSASIEESEAIQPTKLQIYHLISSERRMSAWQFYTSIGSPKYICAPMVEQSELPFRMLCRKYGSDCCYTPMFHSAQFVKSQHYRTLNFSTCETDRPLIVQFCANNEDIFLKAARMVVGQADAVDLNLGCPQHIARRGYYGSFLQENPQLIYRLLSKLSSELSIPVTAKIRILNTDDDTLRYAKMVEAAGASLITIHGRTRPQKGQYAGHANWSIIRKLKQSLVIPVIANGSVYLHTDVHRCLTESHADGVMAAQGLLRNPALFANIRIPEVQLAEEYLTFVLQYPVRLSSVRAHLFKILQATCMAYPHFSDLLGEAKSLEEFHDILHTIRVNRENIKYNDEFNDESWTSSLRHLPLPAPSYDEVDGVGLMFSGDD
jgi:tRNA-dihydrouridine synthase 1